MKKFVYSVYDTGGHRECNDEVVAKTFDEAEEIMEMRYDVDEFYWKVNNVIEELTCE